uniref:Uncharacterized protein n=1 Tax=Anguilla anguilla TaxID=7936 RepID=A0A0E9R3D3_ANGAN
MAGGIMHNKLSSTGTMAGLMMSYLLEWASSFYRSILYSRKGQTLVQYKFVAQLEPPLELIRLSFLNSKNK